MDELNWMLQQDKIPRAIAAEVRRFWRKSQSLRRRKRYHSLIEHLSPELQRKIEFCLGDNVRPAVPSIGLLVNLTSPWDGLRRSGITLLCVHP